VRGGSGKFAGMASQNLLYKTEEESNGDYR
jgi:hypothetical protein